MADDSTSAALNKTPLNDVHRGLGAKMVDFGGWDMPVEYSGILAEHMAVRGRVGLFDVSHMGEIEIRGPRALELIEHVTTNRAAGSTPACSTSAAASSTICSFTAWTKTATFCV